MWPAPIDWSTFNDSEQVSVARLGKQVRAQAVDIPVMSVVCFVVATAPPFDDDLGRHKAIEDFTEQFIPQSCVDAFTVAVLPPRTRFDEMSSRRPNQFSIA